MMTEKIAVSHPGAIGDALYTLPTIRWLAEKHGCQVDFYTSIYCKPMKSLMEYQEEIDQVVLMESPEYVVTGSGPGFQPWRMPVPEENYEAVYQLGFQTNPYCNLPDYIAETAGAPTGLPVRYDMPDKGKFHIEGDYIVIAPKGETATLVNAESDVFEDICKYSKVQVVQVGGPGEGVNNPKTLNLAGKADMLETLGILRGAMAYCGWMSSNLVLANGFPNLLKFIPHDGIHWDMQHVLYSANHHYLVDPTGFDVLRRIFPMDTYSKVLDLNDHVDEMDHVDSIVQIMTGVASRFEHPLRRWEYGLALHVIRKNGGTDVLDVGGGGSIFAPAAEWPDVGLLVTQVDPGDCASWVRDQRARLMNYSDDVHLSYIQEDFMTYQENLDLIGQYDAVTCLSVIEHVAKPAPFIKKLASRVKPGGLLVITTDFHPSGKPKVDGHLRTYNKRSMDTMITALKKLGFEFFGSKPDWTYNGDDVNDAYSFAALVMSKGQKKARL